MAKVIVKSVTTLDAKYAARDVFWAAYGKTNAAARAAYDAVATVSNVANAKASRAWDVYRDADAYDKSATISSAYAAADIADTADAAVDAARLALIAGIDSCNIK